MKNLSVLFLSVLFLIMGSCSTKEEIPPEDKAQLVQLRNEIVNDLKGNLLEFWAKYSVDQNDPNEGFYGRIANDGTGIENAPKHNVLFARYLWTYSTAYRVFGDEKYLQLANRAYNYLSNFFWDKENGGVYWVLNADGTVQNSGKMTYGQSFAIYAFSEYYRVTRNEESLRKAIKIYQLLKERAYDPENGGYLEAFTSDWNYVEGRGMAGKQAKSMNTHLHVLEAFTNLYRVYPDDDLKERLYAMTDVFNNHILNTKTYHQELFFAKDWTVAGRFDSYGHDIEFSWLFCEAAEVLKDEDLIKQIEETAVKVAQSQLTDGMNSDGAMIYEKTGDDHYNKKISWWVQAEAVVGYVNAYEISHNKKFLDAATGVWSYVKKHMIDYEYGGWYPMLDENGNHDSNGIKGDEWTCPYHNSRMGFEIYRRLGDLE